MNNFDRARNIVQSKTLPMMTGSNTDAANIERNRAIESIEKQLDAGVSPGAAIVPPGCRKWLEK